MNDYVSNTNGARKIGRSHRSVIIRTIQRQRAVAGNILQPRRHRTPKQRRTMTGSNALHHVRLQNAAFDPNNTGTEARQTLGQRLLGQCVRTPGFAPKPPRMLQLAAFLTCCAVLLGQLSCITATCSRMLSREAAAIVVQVRVCTRRV